MNFLFPTIQKLKWTLKLKTDRPHKNNMPFNAETQIFNHSKCNIFFVIKYEVCLQNKVKTFRSLTASVMKYWSKSKLFPEKFAKVRQY